MTPGGVRAILRRLMRSRLPLALALVAALSAGATGCSSPCQDLGDRICQCEPEGQVRNNCKTNVKARVKASSPTADESSACTTLLGTCPDPNGDRIQCAWMLNTCAGRVACGLALPEPGGGDGCTNLDLPEAAIAPAPVTAPETATAPVSSPAPAGDVR